MIRDLNSAANPAGNSAFELTYSAQRFCFRPRMPLAKDPIETALLMLAFAGLCHALYLAAGQLLLPERRKTNALSAWLYAGVALIFLDVLVVVGSPQLLFQSVPSLEFSLVLFRFLLGPLAYSYFGFMILDASRQATASRGAQIAASTQDRTYPGWPHLLPGLCLLSAGLGLVLIDLARLIVGDRCAMCLFVQTAVTEQLSRALLIAVGNLQIAVYLLPGIYTATRLLCRGKERAAALTAALLGIAALTAAMLQAIGGLPHYAGGERGFVRGDLSGIFGISLLLVALYAVGLLGQRYPHFWQSLRIEARRLGRRRENRLRRLSPEILQRNLDELMLTEQIYRDEDLRLSTVAALLDITPHQLSYYLNEVLRIDFAAYINQHRVQAVESALRAPENAAVPVLVIGLDAGFNSKTAFYRAFGDATGMSPSKYRERFRTRDAN